MEIEIWLNVHPAFNVISIINYYSEIHVLEEISLKYMGWFYTQAFNAQWQVPVYIKLTLLILITFLKAGHGRSSGIISIYTPKENKGQKYFLLSQCKSLIVPDQMNQPVREYSAQISRGNYSHQKLIKH